jgi:hypothetical protein
LRSAEIQSGQIERRRARQRGQGRQGKGGKGKADRGHLRLLSEPISLVLQFLNRIVHLVYPNLNRSVQIYPLADPGGGA